MGRAPCCDKSKVKRGPWSPEEDALLKSFIQAHGAGGNWIALPRKAGLNRCGKSCRLRWLNYLRPNIRHGGFTEEEDYIICTLFSAIGSRWSVIASKLPGRTDNDVKNYWNTKLKKKIKAAQVPGFEPTSLHSTNTTMDHHPNKNAQSVRPPIATPFTQLKPEPEPTAYDHGYNSFSSCNIINNNTFENSVPAQQMWDPLHQVSGHNWEVPTSSRCSSSIGGCAGVGGEEVEEDDMDDFWLRLLVDQSTFFGGPSSSSQVVGHEKKSGFDTVLFGGGPVFPSFC